MDFIKNLLKVDQNWGLETHIPKNMKMFVFFINLVSQNHPQTLPKSRKFNDKSM